MRYRIAIGISIPLIFHVFFLSAQRVMYVAPVEDRFTLRVDLAGRAGSYYWIQTSRRIGTHEERQFEIYNERMKPVNTVPFSFSDTAMKEYLVFGESYFEQLALVGDVKTTRVLVKRYDPEGSTWGDARTVGVFPFAESGNNFLLVRSADRSRMLLLGFESIAGKSPRLHAILFNQDWQALYDRIYQHPFITQPMIQDDFTNYPLENFDKGPVKLANNGQWLMESPSRTNRNYLLFHFNAEDTGVAYKEMTLPSSSTMEDVDLTISNEREEASAAVLSTFHYDALKNVRVVHYSMRSKSFDFDSSYRFSTLVSGKVKEDNVVKESFMAVPGSGFLLLKEYGRIFTEWYDEPDQPYDEQWDPAYLFASNDIPDNGVRAPVLRDGYARYHTLGGLGGSHERGDLGMFYFPASRGDTCWSGMISKEQVTELNSPNLSYLMVPVRNKLFFLYNSFFRGEDPFATTTILDHRGELLQDAGVLFWKFRNTNLHFQQSRQISEEEVVIPYDVNYKRNGFAIVRF
ncbi:MAG TPA: hypothetical protein VL832_20565 [Puia sp.]|nr:hypothetical protein [Puia sp.]